MARIALTEAQIVAFHRQFEEAGLSQVETGVMKDVAGDWIADEDDTPMVATEETAADWIAARGEPAERRGDLMVFKDRVAGGRRGTTIRTVYVLPTAFGTVAIVSV